MFTKILHGYAIHAYCHTDVVSVHMPNGDHLGYFKNERAARRAINRRIREDKELLALAA